MIYELQCCNRVETWLSSHTYLPHVCSYHWKISSRRHSPPLLGEILFQYFWSVKSAEWSQLSLSAPFQFGLSGWNSERNHQEKRCCNWTFVFDPSGRLVYYWSFIVSLAFLYNFWVSSQQIVFCIFYLFISSGYRL